MTVPHRVRASAAIAQRQAYRGELPLRSLPRLSAALGDAAGALRVGLQAERVQGRECLHGELHGELKLVCQRCERSFDWPLHASVDLQLVHTEEEEAAVLHDADPYRVQDDVLPLHELIEDEVLLALPMLPRCESCENEVNAASAPAAGAGGEAKGLRENPFAQLQDRLKKR